ncbi:protein unc-50 homolog [Bemisia tabaci]|uniref:protein unc-50 homolog n=1 Tax=Bemisia tabaci TaxID=7038 RepID=UPI0008F9E410|nr:PREDICTED: protein unc-50 homolog [Bemisia tabaci]
MYSNLRKDSVASTGSYLPAPATHRGCMSAAMKRYRYLRRFFKFSQMDFEFAFWQMTYLFSAPQKVYRNFHYRKETKSQFARDDPAFLVLLSLWLFVSSLGFTLILSLNFWEFLKFFLYLVFVDCIFFGFCIASLFWFITNKYLIKPSHKGQDVEWGYAFDVHLNAFFPSFAISHVIQLFFYNALISHDWFLARLFGNLLWCVAFTYYVYITFLGYSCLPILQKTQVLLSPLILLGLMLIVSIAAGWNWSSSVMDFYHYRVL